MEKKKSNAALVIILLVTAALISFAFCTVSVISDLLSKERGGRIARRVRRIYLVLLGGILSAMLASAFVKNTFAFFIPEVWITASAASDLTSSAKAGLMNGILSAWSFIAWAIALLPWPRLEFTSCDDIS